MPLKVKKRAWLALAGALAIVLAVIALSRHQAAEPAAPSPEPAATQTLPPAPTPSPSPTPFHSSRNDAYFNGALFIGDSIMEGVRRYVTDQRGEEPTLGEAKFLTSMLGIGLVDLLGERDWHYSFRFRGVDMPLDEILGYIQPRRVFLMLGMNDLQQQPVTPEIVLERYMRVLDLIAEALPDAELIAMTATPVTASEAERRPVYVRNEAFGNNMVQIYVQMFKEECEKRDIPYVDVYTALCDDNGTLPEEYSSDGRIHLTEDASKLVVDALYAYASDKPDKGDGKP